MNVLHRFFQKYQNWLGVLVLIDFTLVALVSPSLPTPTNLYPTTQPQPRASALITMPHPPDSEHILGTLPQSVDVLQQLVTGARQALTFSLKAGIISAIIGVLLGAVSGYLGGWASTIIMRLADGMLAIPVITGLVMIRQVQAVLASQAVPVAQGDALGALQAQYNAAIIRIYSFDTTLWAIILVSWIFYARIIHGMVAALKNADYIQAARAMGASSGRIILRHLIPNAISPAIVLLARDLGWVVILQASLGFAGFGGGSIWGSILLQGRDWIIGAGGNPFGYWWVWVPATLVIILYGISWNLVGDGLNDALNPRVT